MKNRQYIRLLEEDSVYTKYKALNSKVEEAYNNFTYNSIYHHGTDAYKKAIAAYHEASTNVDNFLEAESPKDYTYKQKWCDMLLEAIEKIADEKYSDVPYWIDTGSKLNIALAMLEQFKRDIKR